MNTRTASAPLESLFEQLGYGPSLLAHDIAPPGRSEQIEVVAFTRAEPRDLLTSAIAGGTQHRSRPSDLLELARAIAAPFSMYADGEEATLYRVGASSTGDRSVKTFELHDPNAEDIQTFRRELDPTALQQAKTGARQLALFPLDIRLLDAARHHSVGSLRTRLEAAFAQVIEYGSPAREAARVVVNALACVVVRDKYGRKADTAAQMVAFALQRYPRYFGVLAEWESSAPEVTSHVLEELSTGVDYAAVDARTINSAYEQLFVTQAIRKDLGIFYTPPEFATRILDALPIEELSPEQRCVFDPACGSGNLLLATQERLQALAPGSWSPEQTHEWLKTHLAGADVDPLAVELARLSLLVSALPLGNTWRIENTDFLTDSVNIDPVPTLLVTNPPWHLSKGTRRDKATRFLHQSLAMLADGGFLACILPVAWLSTDVHRESRAELARQCDVFEVWRLPRDMFAPGARMGCAVVFARKTRSPERRWVAFRWTNAGKQRRECFLERGIPSFTALVPARRTNERLTWGPFDDFLLDHPPEKRLSDIATLTSGIVQRGTLPRTKRQARHRIPVLARGAEPTIYRAIPRTAVTWVDSLEQFVTTEAHADRLRVMPKLLIQADRFPDNPWRARPVLDLLGIVPVGVWHAVIHATQEGTYALLALLAASPISCWLHTHAAAKRITLELLGELPLPIDFETNRARLARLGL